MNEKTYTFFRKNFLIILIILLFLGGFFSSYFSKGFIYSLINNDVSDTLYFIDSFGAFAGFIFVLIVILEVVLAPIPPLILYIVAGTLFGGFFGGILTLLGNIIGALIDFKIARIFGQERVEKRLDKNLKKKFDNFFEKYGGISIFILRINPLTTSDIVSYLSGLTKIKTSVFLLATGVGLAPMIFLQTYLGEMVITKNPFLFTITILFSILYLIVFIYLIIISFFNKK